MLILTLNSNVHVSCQRILFFYDKSIWFLCPYRTCIGEIKCHNNLVIAYVQDAFSTTMNIEITQAKFILTLYIMEYMQLSSLKVDFVYNCYRNL